MSPLPLWAADGWGPPTSSTTAARIAIEGTDEQIAQAESILKGHGIQEWQLYQSTDH
ncbi:MAG: hypothetical protein ACRC8Y_10405 [Chroococcales cyanobacterium]